MTQQFLPITQTWLPNGIEAQEAICQHSSCGMKIVYLKDLQRRKHNGLKFFKNVYVDTIIAKYIIVYNILTISVIFGD